MSAAEATQPATTGPVGIGGWLILPLLGLVATPLIQIFNLLGSGDTLMVAESLGGARQALIIAELIGNVLIFLILPLVCLVLLSQKKRTFPRVYVTYAVVSAIFFFLDLFLGYVMFAEVYQSGQAEFFDRDTIRGIVGAVAGLAIWTPYMLNSVRVKNTFVN
jgi:hypothetical protein